MFGAARDAADMVLLRDDFTSIVDGVEEGRLIFNNFRKVWLETGVGLATLQPLCFEVVSDFFRGFVLGVSLGGSLIFLLCSLQDLCGIKPFVRYSRISPMSSY